MTTRTRRPTVKDENQPWTSNYPPLQNWLEENRARCLWQVPTSKGESPGAYVECWLVGTRPIIVIARANKMGWELYTALDTVRIDATLEDAARRCGVDVVTKG